MLVLDGVCLKIRNRHWLRSAVYIMSKSPPVPTDRELRQLCEQLCNQATDVVAAFQTCRCSGNVRATVPDGGRGVNALKQGTTAPSDEPAENAGTVGTQTVPAIPESEEPAPKGATTTSTESPIDIEVPVEPARGPLTLMRLPPEIRALIWWEVLRPEGGFVPIVPWGRPGHLDKGRIRASILGFSGSLDALRFHRARTALIDRKRNPGDDERSSASLVSASSWQRQGEHVDARFGWSLLHINKQIYEEAEAAYWRRVASDGLMFSFGCGRNQGDYWGLAAARTFFNDFTTKYLQTIRRMHLDLRRPDDDGPNGYGGQAVVLVRAGVQTVNFARALGAVLDNIGTNLTGLRHLSLTFGGWVPDVRQTPVSGLQCSYYVFLNSTNSYPQWIEDTGYPPANARVSGRLQSSQLWVSRLQKITGLTRLRLRVMYAPRYPDTIDARLDQDPGVQRTIHFMSMLRGSMLVNGAALGVGNMRAWANKRQATADQFTIVVQCDDSWDEENKAHRHHIEDYKYDPIGGLNDFGDRFRWDPDAES